MGAKKQIACCNNLWLWNRYCCLFVLHRLAHVLEIRPEKLHLSKLNCSIHQGFGTLHQGFRTLGCCLQFADQFHVISINPRIACGGTLWRLNGGGREYVFERFSN
jgi:hypothetical protein